MMFLSIRWKIKKEPRGGSFLLIRTCRFIQDRQGRMQSVKELQDGLDHPYTSQ